jgi:hypothetical protein
MPGVSYNATNFPAAYHPRLAGRQSLSFTWAELVWSAISVGRAELLHLFRYGPFSAFEMVYRAAILYANLNQTNSNRLRRSSAYDGLDPSEKSAISYFMGMTLAKLFADKLLDVPWLMHLDVYRAQLGPAFLTGNSRPDLVGQNISRDWIAVESKGRTNDLDQVALDRAKEQVENLSTIGGVAPVLRIALLAYFDDGTLACALDDPSERDRKGVKEMPDMPLTRENLIEGYYRPFREWLLEAPNIQIEEIDNRRYRVGYLPEVDVSIGIEDDLLAENPLDTANRRRGRESKENEYQAPDGLLVRVGELWSDANMRRQPQERHRLSLRA